MLASACSDGDGGSTTTADTTSTTVAQGDLEARLLTAADLPPGYGPSDEVDDTVTTFCAGQDATAGLRATGRAVAGFTRTPAGASVVHLVFRFEGDGAARFVTQAEELLRGCSDVPDASGLAFSYEPVSPSVAEALDELDGVTSRYGTSVGSGRLAVDVAVARQGDLGILLAVLGVDLPRADLDTLATQAFGAAAARLSDGR